MTIDAARARTAADASALAGASADEAAARRVAMLNGGVLESYRESADGVVVVVSVGTATATARAS